uniref:Pyrin domain-containing protein n=1 Tax=Xiphophorus couchianus TaxID=32473 RepID=A0A3B5LR35_9TELE
LDLDSREMKYFHWYLHTSKDGFKPIKKGQLEDADRLDTVDLMVQTYASNTKTVTGKILEKINNNKGLLDGRKCLKHQSNIL